MPCFILIKNTPNTYRKGEVISVYPSDVTLTDGIDKTKYEEKNGYGTWDRRTVLVYLSDKDFKDVEIQALLEEDETGVNRRKRVIIEQDGNSPYYDDLINYARVDTTYEVLESLIV